MTKFLNISTDNTLGGANSAHEVVPSQKAVKEYIDSANESLTARYIKQHISSSRASYTFETKGPTYFISEIEGDIASVDLSLSMRFNNVNHILIENPTLQDVEVFMEHITLNGTRITKYYAPPLTVEAKSARLLTIHAGSINRTPYVIIDQSERLLIKSF